jgi:DNA replication protein DnaC
MNTETIEKLKSMRLSGFVDALTEQGESAIYADMSFDERLGFLVDAEYFKRKNTRIATAIKTAKLKSNAYVESLDYSAARNLKKQLVAELVSGKWIAAAQNIIITGPTGVGKSYLASALAEKACRLEFKALHIKVNELIRQIMLAHAEGTYPKLVTKFSKIHILVIDEWLRNPLKTEHAREMLDIIDERYGKLSIIFCSQLPVKNWHESIKDPTVADAILDRIVHNAHRIELQGESLRKTKGGKASLRSDN